MTTCFVIGPIGNRFAPVGDPARQIYEDSLQVFEDVIQAACQRVGIEPIRADQIAVAGEITEQVFRHIYEDEIVIADVSGGNPNVMYELGLRHTTGKLTIQIGEFGQLPFDVNTIRTIQFSRSPRGIIDARVELERALQAGMLEGQDQLTAARIWNNLRDAPADSILVNIASESQVDLLDAEDGPGLLDMLGSIEESMTAMQDSATSIAEAIQVIGMATEVASAEMQDATRANASNVTRLSLISKYASEIGRPSEKLESSAADFGDRMESINGGVTAMLSMIESSSEENLPEGSEEFLEQLISLAESSREGMEGLNSFGTAAEGLGSLSRQLRGPGKRISNAVESMRRAMAQVDQWETAARTLQAKF